MLLEGRKAIVSGALSGIGKATAVPLAAGAAKVMVQTRGGALDPRFV